MVIDLPVEKTYDPGPMRCIYCLASAADGKLGREHIIARNLGGKLVLRNASCGKCEKIINETIETPALDTMWKSPRTQLGMRSSRRLATLKYGIWEDQGKGASPKNFDGLNFRFVEVPLADRAFAIIMIKLAPPGYLAGRQPVETFAVVGKAAYVEGGAPFQLAAGERCKIFEPFMPQVICGFIAKVAHGAAVAELGLEAFDAFLPPVIFGDDLCLSHYVGGSRMRARHTSALHRVRLEIRAGLISAHVQLFARYGMPVFEAVVGRAKGALATLQLGACFQHTDLQG